MEGDEKALFEAIQENNLGMVSRLVGEGNINVNAKSKESSTTLIATAAANGQAEIVKLLLDKGADVDNTKDGLGIPALIWAIMGGSLEIFKLFIDKEVDVETRSEAYDITPLMQAAWNGNVEMVKLLVEKGVNINVVNKHGETALMFAVMNGCTEIVQILIDKGANVNVREKEGNTALMVAVYKGQMKNIKLLIDKGADVTAEDDRKAALACRPDQRMRDDKNYTRINSTIKLEGIMIENKNVLSEKIQDNNLEAIQTLYDNLKDMYHLLEEGTDASIKEKKGCSVLLATICYGCIVTNDLLLKKGGYTTVKEIFIKMRSYLLDQLDHIVEEPNEHIKTFLSYLDNEIDMTEEESSLCSAIKNNDLEMMKRFLKEGLDVNARVKNSSCSLIAIAAEYGQNEIIKFLIERGADINVKDKEGWTPLARGILGEHEETVRLLIKHEADINAAVSKKGGTALVIGASQGCTKTVKLLINKGADVNAKDEQGITALMLAALNGHIEIVQLLLESGVQINAGNEEGQTALMAAANNGHAGIIKLLMNNGIDVNMTDKHGDTALLFAVYKGHTGIANLLMESDSIWVTNIEAQS